MQESEKHVHNLIRDFGRDLANIELCGNNLHE